MFGWSCFHLSNSLLITHSIPPDKDILVIFEDDAESSILELNVTIVEELGDMKVDLLFLGERFRSVVEFYLSCLFVVCVVDFICFLLVCVCDVGF